MTGKITNLHTGTRYKCGSCERDFASTKNRTIHFKQVHLNQKRALCPVDNCNYSCNDHGIMKVHLFDVHAIGTEARCKDCSKNSQTTGSMKGILRFVQSLKIKIVPYVKNLTSPLKDSWGKWMWYTKARLESSVTSVGRCTWTRSH